MARIAVWRRKVILNMFHPTLEEGDFHNLRIGGTRRLPRHLAARGILPLLF
jgi:hypothetical protein